MSKRTGPSNPILRGLIRDLRKISASNKVNIWKRVANDLERATRKRRIVNIDRINKYTKDNEVIVVPGKVLGDGELKHKVTVAALRFSTTAESKINKSGKAILLDAFIKENPKGEGVRIIG